MVPKFPPLDDFGSRICVCGPSNAGKSTLAQALSKKLSAPAVHLDLLRHLPNTDWVQRSDEEFARMHDEAIEGDRWIIEGNYFSHIDKRLARATGIILLGSEPWRGLGRYFRRTLFERDRVGQLEGNKDSVKWEMIRWIIFEQPKKRESYRVRLQDRGLPFIALDSMRELNRLYQHWDLER